MAGQEGEALRLVAQQTGGQVAMANTHLAVVGDTAGDAERLQANTDSLGGVGSHLATLLQGDGGTTYVSPLGVLKTDLLGLLTGLVGVDAILVADGVGLLDILDAVGIQCSNHLLDATVL